MRDAAGLSSTTQITITIQGANDAPSDITGTLTIAENSANLANVGTLSQVDVDSGDGASYALTNDAEDDLQSMAPPAKSPLPTEACSTLKPIRRIRLSFK